MEIIGVIRKRVVEKAIYGELSAQRKEEIRNTAETLSKEFIDKITKLAEQKRILLVNPDRILSSYLEDTIGYLQNYFGSIDESHEQPQMFHYKGLGHYDIQHAINARDCSADELISFDKAFSDLRELFGSDFLKVSVPI